MRSRSRSSGGRAGRGGALVLLAALLAAAGGAGCWRDDGPPAVITEQPADAEIFEGQVAVFQVRATSTNGIRYAWRRNGIDIPGATDSHVVTAPAAPEDDGSIYSVIVTNVGGTSVESRGARLTVHPPLDLRFQWVGAPFAPTFTLGMNIMTGWMKTFPGTGSPLLVGTGFCGAYGTCDWYFAVATGVPGMAITYDAGRLDLLPEAWAADLPSDTIVTSLDLQEGSNAYAMSLSRTTQVGAFTSVVQGAVPPDQLQAAASSEGAAGRVLTAVSYRAGLVSYVSYGWSLDTATVYEARVVTTPFDAVVAAAEALAAEGYVLTACGAGNGGANGLVLVGTRAQGSTAPRSVVFPANVSALDGHALVAFLFDPGTSAYTLIGER